jgi:RNA polymerase sigma-70 factor (ECF subfamily)
MMEINQILDNFFRHEAGRMVAVLTKVFGLKEVDIAEDIVQETLVAALESWRFKGLPDNPRAWLYRVAKNRTLDYLRRIQNFEKKIVPKIAHTLETTEKEQVWLDDFFLETEIEDAQLRMMFACCHPSISAENQLVIILKTLCGLSIGEIAAALLSNEDTIAKRFFRAKERIKNEQLSFEVPRGQELNERLDAVLKAIYLLFNEGYYSAIDNQLLRHDLCFEALRLGVLLTKNPLSNLPKTNALLALMCFQAARFAARFDADGGIVLLENQDRSLWDKNLTRQAYIFFKSSQTSEMISAYHIEAAIASYHAQAARFSVTNWQAIYYCYSLLYHMQPSAIIALNRGIALGYTEGYQKGIDFLLKIEGLEKNYFYHTALGDFYKKLNKQELAQVAYEKALSLAKRPAEKALIEKKRQTSQQYVPRR